mmetsp:Transcript_116127/g.339563  ORF Transcript_116127/g.339563 Transcript_116127/m.339563 type:complete len:259 (+) Transcript_116127:735-1511(+)
MEQLPRAAQDRVVARGAHGRQPGPRGPHVAGPPPALGRWRLYGPVHGRHLPPELGAVHLDRPRLKLHLRGVAGDQRALVHEHGAFVQIAARQDLHALRRRAPGQSRERRRQLHAVLGRRGGVGVEGVVVGRRDVRGHEVGGRGGDQALHGGVLIWHAHVDADAGVTAHGLRQVEEAHPSSRGTSEQRSSLLRIHREQVTISSSFALPAGFLQGCHDRERLAKCLQAWVAKPSCCFRPGTRRGTCRGESADCILRVFHH